MAKGKSQQLCWVSKMSTNDEEGDEARGRVLAIFDVDVYEHADEEDDLTSESNFADRCADEGIVGDSLGTPPEHPERGVGAQNAGLWAEWDKFTQEVEDDCGHRNMSCCATATVAPTASWASAKRMDFGSSRFQSVSHGTFTSSTLSNLHKQRIRGNERQAGGAHERVAGVKACDDGTVTTMQPRATFGLTR